LAPLFEAVDLNCQIIPNTTLIIDLYQSGLFNMATIAREHQLFVKINPFSVIICCPCQHAVWPSEVEWHLKGLKHQLSKKDMQQIQTAIQ
jgi:hypothetical protein